MTKLDFMDTLREKLSGLPAEDVEQSLAFYLESIEDRMEEGQSETEAVAQMGDIDKLAAQIEQGLSLSGLVRAKVKASHARAGNKTLWVILALCGSPIWLSLALTGFCIVLAVYISVWAIIVTLYAALLSIGCVGVCGIAGAIIQFFVSNALTGWMLLGMGIAACGLFWMLMSPVFWTGKRLILLTVQFLRWCKRRVSKRGESYT